MPSPRANLENSTPNSLYLILSLVLLSLSFVGLLLFFRFRHQVAPAPYDVAIIQDVTPTPTIADFETNSVTASPSATPTPAFQTFSGTNDQFTMVYASSRKLYQDNELSGRRYTLFSPAGNIAIHVGKRWSWTYPDRQFTTSFLVSGYPTFIYDIDSQTIVDFQVGDNLFTIQCLHHNQSSLKTECQQFLKDFKI